MKHLVLFLIALATIATVQAKKVKVTIDGTVSPTQSKVYLIVNEDTAHAQLLPIKDGKFSTTVEVERDAFIRLHDWKEWPERSVFVLIPDSRHITIDWNTGAIQGSKMSQKLQLTCKQIRDASPEGFHIDVFTDDPEAWRDAMDRGNAIRQQMLEEQKSIAKKVMLENKNSIISVWIAYCFPELFEGELNAIIDDIKPTWANHPLLKMKR